MFDISMAEWSQNAPARARLLLVGGLVALTGVLALVFSLREPGSIAIAEWWPAASAAVAAALCARKHERPYVAVGVVLLVFLGLLSGGRSLELSFLDSVGNAVEAWLVAAIIAARRQQLSLKTVADVGRLLVATVAGAAVAALCVATGAHLVGLDFAASFVPIAAAHALTIVCIVPLVIIPRLHFRVSTPPKTIAISGALVLSVLAAFYPGSPAPLTFLPVPILAWAALSQSMFTAVFQLIGVLGGISALTIFGGGPFAYVTGAVPGIAFLQLYSFTLAALALLIGAAAQERRVIERERLALASLVRGAFERGPNGFAVLQEAASNWFELIEINAAAPALVPDSFEHSAGQWRLQRASRLHEIISRLSAGTEQTFEWSAAPGAASTAQLTITVGHQPNGSRTVVLAITDLAPMREAQRKLEEQLARERAISNELRKLNQQKDDFVASVSHELRTPITSILGYAEDMRENHGVTADEESLEVIERNAMRLLAVVDDVLLISRRNSDTSEPPARRRIAVGRAIDQCVSDLGRFAASKSVEVHVKVAPDTYLYVPESDFARVLSNLVTNAIKFSVPGATVKITADTKGDEVMLEVEDSGRGISREDRDRIFDPFYRSPQAIRDGIPGTGLGLPISRDLVHSMGGSIGLKSVLGEGTCVEVRIPLVRPEATQ
ncbi:signal transduction histidine kinase [Microbacterium halimionae]|uniref:histidine kinase n=1 Tax=Microbacterium halimionae TaxID=1526413 RepID=A0A7W3JQW6_9MICO|nr:HAMP domain-containing sensor histidine kinase [Microbacterium halimionae]MBA8817384.1 signal transduction histidine kinase [Microbacterium halimionae]NII96018.1 signal transduction histidine kinase [Microbacterium halimionae]